MEILPVFDSPKFPASHIYIHSSSRVAGLAAGLFSRSREKYLLLVINIHGRYAACLLVALIVSLAIAPLSVRAADLFGGGALTPELLRDFHIVFAGGDRLDNAATSDGQDISITTNQLGVGGNIWNNEHNQVLAGIQLERRDFNQRIALPDGFATPQQLDRVSASLHYKHITAGDWSLSQSIQYSEGETDQASITVEDSVDLIGVAALVSEPGVGWLFGYAYLEKDTIDSKFLPVIEYIYAKASDEWSIVVGFPLLDFSYTPHPDWLVGGGGLAVSYKVTQTNILRFGFTQNAWAYGLKGPNVKGIEYEAQRVSLDWTALYPIDHRNTGVTVNALLGWEFNRELGADQKLTVDDTAVVGLEVSLFF